MRWLVDGYNVIRRSPELQSRERESLQAGREALCARLVEVARLSHDTFTVVFDGAQAGGRVGGGAGVTVIFSSARDSADRVLARMAREGGAVVSNDREVRQAATRAGAIAVTTDQFLRRLAEAAAAGEGKDEDDEEDDRPRDPGKGNPRRMSRRDRAARRALDRLIAGRPARPRHRA